MFFIADLQKGKFPGFQGALKQGFKSWRNYGRPMQKLFIFRALRQRRTSDCLWWVTPMQQRAFRSPDFQKRSWLKEEVGEELRSTINLWQINSD
jgi:hypothetical protein